MARYSTLMLLLVVVLLALSALAAYRAYRLHFVVPVIWVNRTGLPMAAITPSLEQATALVRHDLPAMSHSMENRFSARRNEIRVSAGASAAFFTGAVLMLMIGRRRDSKPSRAAVPESDSSSGSM